jgi:hypothetical protein
VCGESRMHGDNGGDGKTQFGCASCPYPLQTGGTVAVPTVLVQTQVGGGFTSRR